MMHSKIKNQKTLDEETLVWLKNRKTLILPGRPARELEEGKSKQQLQAAKRQKFMKIRAIALKEICDLTSLAELLPEEQLNQVFNQEKLLPLFQAIFSFSQSSNRPSQLQDETLQASVLEKKRERLLPLCYQLIQMLDDYSFSEPLTRPMRSVTALEGPLLAGVKAILFRSMTP
jgi:hypothetical protein